MANDLYVYKADWVNHNGSPIFSIDIDPSGVRFATAGNRDVKVWSLAPFTRRGAEDGGVWTGSGSRSDDDDDGSSDDDNDDGGGGRRRGGPKPRHELMMGSGTTGFGGEAQAQAGPGNGSEGGAGNGEGGRVHRLLATLSRHQGAVNVVAWSQSGEFLASGADDNTVIVWGLKEEAQRTFGSTEVNHENWGFYAALRGHEADVTDLAWSPDDSLIASCGVDSQIRVWDTSEFELVTTLTGHKKYVQGVTWDPVGTYLASEATDRTLVIWKTADWTIAATIADPFAAGPSDSFFRRCHWSPDGQWVTAPYAANNTNPVAAVVTRGTWAVDAEFVGHSEPVVVAKYNPRLFAVPGAERGSASAPRQYFVCCAIGSADNSISVWTSAKDRPMLIGTGLFDHAVMDLAWSGDGRTLMACSYDGSVAAFTFESGPDQVLSTPLPPPEVDAILSAKYGEFVGKSIRLQEYVETAALRPAEHSNSRSSPLRPPSSPPRQPRIHPPAAGNALAAKFASLPQPPLPRVTQRETLTKSGKRRVQPQLLGSSSSVSQTGFPAPRLAAPSQGVVNTLVPRKRSAPRPAPTAGPPQAVGVVVDDVVGTTRVKRQRLLAPGAEAATTTRLVVTAADLALDAPLPLPTRSLRLSVVAPPSVLGSESPRTERGRPAYQLDVTAWAKAGPAEAGPTSASTLSLMRDGVEVYSAYVPGRVNAMAATAQVVVVATFDDGAVRFLATATGAVVAPPLILGWPAVSISVAGSPPRAVVLTADGTVRVWEIGGPLGALGPTVPPAAHLNTPAPAMPVTAVAKLSVAPLLNAVACGAGERIDVGVAEIGQTADGMVTVRLTNEYVYAYSETADAWMSVADGAHVGSHYFTSSSSFARRAQASGPLAEAQLGLIPRLAHNVAPFLAALSGAEQKLISTAYLETQRAAALALGSADEYAHWTLEYVRRLVRDGAAAKLDAVCTHLLGPAPGVADAADLLERILPELARNADLQHLAARVADALASASRA